MKRIKFTCIILGSLLTLAALNFPQMYPYYFWADKIEIIGINLPVPIVNLIGEVLYSFFSFIFPLLVALYFRGIFNQNWKLFIKLPLITAIASFVGYLISLGIIFLLNLVIKEFLCSGEGCMAVMFMFIVTIPAFIIISLIYSGVTLFLNKNESVYFIKEKIKIIFDNTYLYIGFLFFALILLIISIILSYNCKNLTKKNMDNCVVYKQYSKEDKIFFHKKFPQKIFDLYRQNFNYTNTSGTGAGSGFYKFPDGKYYYSINYIENYAAYYKRQEYLGENFDIIIHLCNSSDDINKIMFLARKDINKKRDIDNINDYDIILTYPLSGIKDFNGNKVFCSYIKSGYDENKTSYGVQDNCFWYNEEEKYIIEIRGDGGTNHKNSLEKYLNDLENVIKYTLNLYPASKNAFYK